MQTPEVDTQHLVPGGGVVLLGGLEDVDTGSVDQDVDAAGLFLGLRHHGGDAVSIQEVDLHTEELAALSSALLLQIIGHRGVQVGNDDVGAVLHQGPGNGLAQSAAAYYQSSTSLQGKYILKVIHNGNLSLSQFC